MNKKRSANQMILLIIIILWIVILTLLALFIVKVKNITKQKDVVSEVCTDYKGIKPVTASGTDAGESFTAPDSEPLVSVETDMESEILDSNIDERQVWICC